MERQELLADLLEVLAVGLDALAELLHVLRAHEAAVLGEMLVVRVHDLHGVHHVVPAPVELKAAR